MADIATTLSAYVDGELDAGEIQRVEALIAADPAVAAQVDQLRETTALLRAACAETFYADTMAHLLLPAHRPHWQERRRLLGAVAAGIVAAMVGFGAGAILPGFVEDKRGHLLTEIAEYHEIFSHETTRLVELGPDRAEELFAWLSERVNRTLAAPDLTALGLTFAGGRMLAVANKPVAEFMYTRKHGLPVALCILASDEAPRGVSLDERGKLRLAHWVDGRHIFVVVGEISAAKAKRIADLASPQFAGS